MIFISLDENKKEKQLKIDCEIIVGDGTKESFSSL